LPYGNAEHTPDKDKMTDIKQRLEYLRTQIESEDISYGEIAELQSLAEYIDAGDVVLLEWAGVPEFDCLHNFDGDDDMAICKTCGVIKVTAR
jgi:hypothetical protein